MRSSDARRLSSNVPGRFYTTETCDGCAYCASVAPDYFEYDKETNKYYVCRQPRSRSEEDAVREAKDDCPLDAISAGERLVPAAVQEKRHERRTRRHKHGIR